MSKNRKKNQQVAAKVGKDAEADNEESCEMDMDGHFGATTSGGAETYPIMCSALRKNGFAMLKGHPCKITEMSTSKTGKHGHAKVNLTGYDIFDGRKYEDMSPSTHNMDVPLVTRTDYQLIDMDEDNYLNLVSQDEKHELREDLHCNHQTDNCKNLLADIKKRHADDEELIITVMCSMGQEVPIACKPMAGKKD